MPVATAGEIAGDVITRTDIGAGGVGNSVGEYFALVGAGQITPI